MARSSLKGSQENRCMEEKKDKESCSGWHGYFLGASPSFNSGMILK